MHMERQVFDRRKTDSDGELAIKGGNVIERSKGTAVIGRITVR